ncbi:MAG: hypothetical protein O7B26_11615, partial [Planctomycetota bacterium]|nr:hypothetical protein [Planctomycetota bacterium]
MFLKAELGWLPGFPIGARRGIVSWMSIPREGDRQPQRVELDRQHLHRATYTWSKLVHRFPRVLPRLVEDVDWWKRGVTHILRRLKGAIHEDAAIPASLLDQDNRYAPPALRSARRLVEQHPRLGPFVHALSWVHYLYPGELAKALRWAQGNAATLENLGRVSERTDSLVESLILWELSRRDGKRVQRLVDFFGDARAFNCPTRGEREFLDQLRPVLKQHKKGAFVQPPVRPAAEFKFFLRLFARWLIRQDRGTRMRALDLFGLVLPLSLFDPWERWWNRVEAVIQKIRDLLTLGPGEIRKSDHQEVNQAIDRLTWFPPQVHIEHVVAFIQHASVPARQQFHKSLLASLKLLPENKNGSLIRAAFLGHWVQLEKEHGEKLVPFLREFRTFQRAAIEDEHLFGPWRHVAEVWEDAWPVYWWGVADTMLNEIKAHRRWRIAFNAMVHCGKACKDPLSPADGEWVCTLARFSSSAEQVGERFAALRKAKYEDAYEGDDPVRCADVLSENAEEFADLVRILSKIEEIDSRDYSMLIRLDAVLEEAGWTGLLRAVVLDGKVEDIVAILRLAEVHQAVSEPIAPPSSAPKNPPVPDWARAYPAVVHSALSVLNSVASDGRAKARRILAKVFPDEGRIEDEIRALQKQVQARPDDDRLRVRLRSLAKRRTEPVAPRQSRVSKATKRIERAIRSAVLSTWKSDLESALTGSLRNLLRTSDDVSCLLGSVHLQAVSSALALKGPAKQLA